MTPGQVRLLGHGRQPQSRWEIRWEAERRWKWKESEVMENQMDQKIAEVMKDTGFPRTPDSGCKEFHAGCLRRLLFLFWLLVSLFFFTLKPPGPKETNNEHPIQKKGNWTEKRLHQAKSKAQLTTLTTQCAKRSNYKHVFNMSQCATGMPTNSRSMKNNVCFSLFVHHWNEPLDFAQTDYQPHYHNMAFADLF